MRIPSLGQLSAVQELCELVDPYSIGEQYDRIFVEAMKQNLVWHRDRSTFYKSLLDSKGFAPESLKEIKDLEDVPPVISTLFKNKKIVSVQEKDIFLHLTSSGTTGQKSQIFFDEWSITSAQSMVDKIFNYYRWNTPEEKCNYLLYSYAPQGANKVGTAYTDNFLCKYASINQVCYALKYFGESEHRFDYFGAVDALKSYEKDGSPVRIFGFPAFLYFTLSKMKELGELPLKLHKDSLVFLGGGWKKNQDKAVAKNELYSLATEMLGIDDNRLRDGFGSVEHCVPYVECSEHKFHVPVWSRVIIRDTMSLKPLGYGEVGYLNLISPYITSMPATSVLMGDLATLHDGRSCSCEIETPYFEIRGRAGVTKGRSCAVAAAELLDNIER